MLGFYPLAIGDPSVRRMPTAVFVRGRGGASRPFESGLLTFVLRRRIARRAGRPSHRPRLYDARMPFLEWVDRCHSE
jgi:hypothetical protein